MDQGFRGFDWSQTALHAGMGMVWLCDECSPVKEEVTIGTIAL